MKNLIVTYGLITGLFLGVFIVISALLLTVDSHLETIESIGNVIMIVIIGGISYHGIKKYRDEVTGGYMSFGQVFIKVFLISLVASVIYSFVWTVYSSVSDRNFEGIYMEMVVREMNEDGASDEEIELIIESVENFSGYYKHPIIKFFITIIEPIFPGVFAALILGFILRRKEEISSETSNLE